MWDLPLNRALTLGQLIMLNSLKANEHLRRAIALRAPGLRPHSGAPVVMKREIRMAVRVGFAGLPNYRRSAQGELDTRADQLADRVDKIKERGLGTIGKHDKALDAQESMIDEMDAMVREGSNDPLGGSSG